MTDFLILLAVFGLPVAAVAGFVSLALDTRDHTG